jgi:hypothetical protein
MAGGLTVDFSELRALRGGSAARKKDNKNTGGEKVPAAPGGYRPQDVLLQRRGRSPLKMPREGTHSGYFAKELHTVNRRLPAGIAQRDRGSGSILGVLLEAPGALCTSASATLSFTVFGVPPMSRH